MPAFTTRKEAEKVMRQVFSPDEEKEYKAWLQTRPEIIQWLAAKYPPTSLYRVKKDAPYVYSCEGSILAIHGYSERSAEDIAGVPSLIVVILSSPNPGLKGITRVHVDPEWVEPVTVDEAFANEN